MSTSAATGLQLGITTLTGDISASGSGSVAATVVGIQGNTVASKTLGSAQDGYILTWINADGYWAAEPAPVSFTAGGDLSGTATSQQVISITGGSGVVNISSSGNIITWNSATTAPGIAQISTTGATGANITLTPQISTNSNGTSGSLIIKLAPPTGSGSEALFVVNRNTTHVAQIGLDSTYQLPCLWLGNVSPTANNAALRINGSYTQFNAAGSYFSFLIGGSYVALSGTGFFEIGTAGLGTANGGNNCIVIDDGAIPTSSPVTSLSLNSILGNLAVTTSNGNNIVLGSLYGSPTYSALYMGVGLTPSATNAVLQTSSTNSTAMLNATDTGSSTVGFGFGGTYYFRLTDNTSEAGMPAVWNLSIGGLTGSYGGGQGVIGIVNAHTVPTTSVTGAGVFYASSGNPFWWTGTTSYQLNLASSMVFYSEIIFVATQATTQSSVSQFVAGTRSFDTTQFPATIGSKTRYVKFIATLQNTAGATKTTVQLWDVYNAVVVTGTALDNSGSVSQVLPYDVTSAALTLGTASGNIRTDNSGMYEVQIEKVGGTSLDSSTCSSARLIIYYA